MKQTLGKASESSRQRALRGKVDLFWGKVDKIRSDFKKTVKQKNGKIWLGFIVIIILGLFLRICAATSPMLTFQHDPGLSIHSNGHVGYIVKIYETGTLPQNNLLEFYHPPLNHIIMAGWMKIVSIIMGGNATMMFLLYSTRVVSFIYSILLLYVVYKILRETGLKKWIRQIILAVYLIHPATALFLTASSFSNDALSVLLIHAAILWLLRWMKKPDMKKSIVLAIITGCAVMTKMSAVILFPIIAVGVLYRIWNEKKKVKLLVKKYWKMVLVFFVIALPIAGWYPVRNYLRFGQDFGYVLDPGENYINHVLQQPGVMLTNKFADFIRIESNWAKKEALYIGDVSVFNRFFFPNIWILMQDQLTIRHSGNMHAITVITAFLEESTSFSAKYEFVALVIILATYISIIVTIAIIRALLSLKKQKWRAVRLIMLSVIVMYIAGVITLTLRLSYVCSMNFRYMIPIMLATMVLMGIDLEETTKGEKYSLRWFYNKILIIGFILMLVTSFIADYVDILNF